MTTCSFCIKTAHYRTLVLSLLLIGSSLVKAQQSNFYTVHHSRYGTFHHYENGGARLVSGIDYAAQIAASQKEYFNSRPRKNLNREQVNKQLADETRKENESRVNREEYYREERERLKKLEEQLKEQERLKREVDYNTAKDILFKTQSLKTQLWLLEVMANAKPVDEDLMLWFGTMVQAGVPTRELNKATLKMSPSFLNSRAKDLDAGRAESLVRNAEYEAALYFINSPDGSDQQVLQLYAYIQAKRYDVALLLLDSIETATPADQLAGALRNGLRLLEKDNQQQKEAAVIAEDLYQFALQRKLERKVDFLNLALLTVAVKLQPKSEAFREERVYINGMLNCRKAQAEDEAFFFN